MTCDKDGIEMIKLGSTVTKDGAQVLTTMMCPKCCARKLERRTNPRYMPMAREKEQLKEEEEKRRKAAWYSCH